MWKKIAYFTLAIIFGFVVYYTTYASKLSEYKLTKVNEAIASEEYHIVPQLFLEVPFDTKSIIKDNSEEAEVKIYPAAGMVNYTLVNGEETKTYSRYENAYLLFIFEINFPIASYTDSGNKNANLSAIKFVGDKGEYDFYFVQDETYNSESYVASPKNESEFTLNCLRDLAAIHNDWNFIPLSLSEKTIESIEAKVGKITSFKLVDSVGEIRMEEEVSLSFDENFFKHEYISGNKRLIDEKLQRYYSLTDTDEMRELADEINKDIENFKNNFEEKTQGTGFATTLPEEEAKPSYIMWQTIGVLSIYIVFAGVMYFTLFYLKKIIAILKKKQKTQSEETSVKQANVNSDNEDLKKEENVEKTTEIE